MMYNSVLLYYHNIPILQTYATPVFARLCTFIMISIRIGCKHEARSCSITFPQRTTVCHRRDYRRKQRSRIGWPMLGSPFGASLCRAR